MNVFFFTYTYFEWFHFQVPSKYVLYRYRDVYIVILLFTNRWWCFVGYKSKAWYKQRKITNIIIITSRKRNKLFYYSVNNIIIFKIIPMMDLGQKLYRLAKLSLRSFKLSYAWSFSPLYTFTSHPRLILHDCSSRLNNSISEFSVTKLFKSYFCTPTNPDNEILDNNLSFFLLPSTPQFFSTTIILLQII